MVETILIYGLGLIGGSIAYRLKDLDTKYKVFGFDVNKSRVEYGTNAGVITEGYTTYEFVPWQTVDLIILCTPVRTLRKIASEIKPFLKNTTIVTDVGSVKGSIVRDLHDLLAPIRFVGGHPIAGTEKEGIENAISTLFVNARIIITPLESTDKQALDIVRDFWQLLGGSVEYMDPYLHDIIFGGISHLPHVVAFSLVDAAMRISQKINFDIITYTGGGFKDTTRIAASTPSMWRDIFLENKENVLKSIKIFKEALADLEKAIINNDEVEIENIIKKVSDRRKKV